MVVTCHSVRRGLPYALQINYGVKMWYVYILKSQIDGNHYTGMSKNVNRRLKQHNSGKVRFTKSRRPFKLIYKESIGCQ